MAKLPRAFLRALFSLFVLVSLLTLFATTQLPSVTAQDNGSIVGSVKNSLGEGVQYAKLQICTWDGSICHAVQENYTDDQGNFSIDLPVGTYRMLVNDRDYNSESEYYPNAAFPSLASDLVVTTTVSLSLSVVLEDAAPPYTMSGRVTDSNGDGIAGVRGYFCEVIGSYCNDDGVTDADGYYTKTVTSAGAYSAFFYHPDGTYSPKYFSNTTNSSDATYIAVRTSAALDNINIQLDEAVRFTGAVYGGSSGVPLDGVNIRICRMVAGSCTNEFSDSTGADNIYLRGGLPPGDYRLFYSHWTQNYDDQYFNNKTTAEDADIVTLAAGETHTTTVHLVERSGVVGTVTDANGNPLESIEVSLHPTNCPAEGCSAPVTGNATDSDGHYYLQHMRPGDYQLQIEDYDGIFHNEWYSNAVAARDAIVLHIVSGEPDKVIDVELARKATISGRVLNTSGQGIFPMSISLMANDAGFYYPVGSAETDEAGNYTFPAVDPGVWYVGFGAYVSEVFPYGYQVEFYDDTTDITQAKPITVEMSAVITGIDAVLLSEAEVLNPTPESTSTPTHTPTSTPTPTATPVTPTPTATPTVTPPSGGPDAIAEFEVQPNEAMTSTVSLGSGRSIVVGVPEGAVSVPTTLRFYAGDNVSGGTQTTFKLGNLTFSISAEQGGSGVEGLEFGQSVTLRITYNEGDVEGLLPEFLELRYYDKATDTWRNDGVRVITHDPATRTIVVEIDHLTTFGLGEGSQEVFLPAVQSRKK